MRKIYSAFDKPPAVNLICKGKGRTKQQFKDDCDINRIVKSALTTGIADHVSDSVASYAAIGPVDFQESMNTIIKAEQMFNALSSKVRRRFDNNAQEFLEFAENPANEDEMIKLGLLNPKEPEPAPVVPAVAPEPAISGGASANTPPAGGV